MWRIDERLFLLNLAPRFQEALARGVISPSQAFEMSRLADHGHQEAVTRLSTKSFSPEDCRVLAKVHQGNTQVNLEKIDLIVKHLNLIKKAMLESASRQEAARLAQGGEA